MTEGGNARKEVSAEDVRHVARLARLRLSEEEVGAYRERLSAIVGYVDRLRGLDLSGADAMGEQPVGVGDLGADAPGPTLSPGTLTAMAPDSYEDFVRVPRVMDGGGGGA
ncbi:MAG: Asp-tRNA(Asn)/Glu-tRNA(Gln) amidotransferase subunit GatC [Phycisphaerales bacterium]|nr:Asp-tRNA(Asn)/Glu-tRNA(Gln) amidotransferase subunit GatC [Phycisphaerales bacterium]